MLRAILFSELTLKKSRKLVQKIAILILVIIGIRTKYKLLLIFLSLFFIPQIVGIPYLSDTLKPVIDKIFEERKYCELDPSKNAERKQSALR